jgi:hypothetical protein
MLDITDEAASPETSDRVQTLMEVAAQGLTEISIKRPSSMEKFLIVAAG